MFTNLQLSVKSAFKVLSIILVGSVLAVSSAFAGPREQAIKLHKVLTGVQPTEATITQMANFIINGDVPSAARLAMQNDYFWNVTLKNWAASYSNENFTPAVGLNDATTTIVGIIANNEPFTNIIKGNYLYVGNPNVANGVPPYSPVPADAQAHFQAFEEAKPNLRNSLQKFTQIIPDSAGIITSQSWGTSFFEAGTNRAVWHSMMMNFQCTELDSMRDISIPGIRVRRDVSRAPGGEPSIFTNKCIGCHATMDAAINAASYFDYDEDNGLTYTPGAVPEKITRGGATYPDGFIPTNDSWKFLGALSANNGLEKLGWSADRAPASGNGMKSLATAISQTRGFSECMAKRVFKRVCLREASVNDSKIIGDLADGFEKDGNYNMFELFAATSTHCIDEE